MPKKLCIYHGNCQDGFSSAWVVYNFFGKENVDFYPGVYQEDPPDVTDKDVILVDFCYKRDVIKKMALQANSILILDHHISANEDIGKLPVDFADPLVYILDKNVIWKDLKYGYFVKTSNLCETFALFDINRSGAGLTWDFFHPLEPRPKILDHIEDRDLWRFKLPGTKAISESVFSYPYDFEGYDWIFSIKEDSEEYSNLLKDGLAMLRKHDRDVDILINLTKRFMFIGEYLVPVANIPVQFTSDAGNKMASKFNGGSLFAACYWDTPEGRVFSLRSTDNGLDVSKIAEQYGGGGHKNESGFKVELGWEGDKPELNDTKTIK